MKAGNVVKLVADVMTVPGVDVFTTAREIAADLMKARKKGAIARFIPGSMVAVAA